jgi:hypothetical protein
MKLTMLHRDVATDEVREGESQIRASDSPAPGECRTHEWPCQTEKTCVTARSSTIS